MKRREREALTQRLLQAAQAGDPAAVTRLREEGAEIDRALTAAVRQNDLPTARLLLSAGASPNGGDDYGSALNHAVGLRSRELLALLLDAGADVDLPGDVMGESPLMWAAWIGAVELVPFLIERGANVNYTVPDYEIANPGGSVLDMAAVHPEVAALLRQAGAVSAKRRI